MAEKGLCCLSNNGIMPGKRQVVFCRLSGQEKFCIGTQKITLVCPSSTKSVPYGLTSFFFFSRKNKIKEHQTFLIEVLKWGEGNPEPTLVSNSFKDISSFPFIGQTVVIFRVIREVGPLYSFHSAASLSRATCHSMATHELTANVSSTLPLE